MTRATALALPAVLAALLAGGAAGAQAALPDPASTLIVPGKSIGGVAPGDTKADAIAAWGPGARCIAGYTTTCIWDHPKALGEGGSIALRGGRIRIVQVSISPLMPDGAKARMRRFHTDNGIRIGSTVAAVRRAFPGVRTEDYEAAAGSLFLGRGATETRFAAILTKGTLDRIAVGTL